MTKSLEADDAYDPALDGDALHGLKDCAATDVGLSIDRRRHLASVMAFLGGEIEQSAAMLRDLAARLSHEFCELGGLDGSSAVQKRLLASTIALQNEDRIQQRLSDLRAALSVLEGALAMGDPVFQADIDRAIIERLRLDEIRGAFAVSIGLADAPAKPSNAVSTPPVGDVDLF